MKESEADVNRKKRPRQQGVDTVLLAGDIGGTKTLIGLFEPGPGRPRAVAVRFFFTLDYDDLTSMSATFVAEGDAKGASIDAACFGVAGPVMGHAAELTKRAVESRRAPRRGPIRPRARESMKGTGTTRLSSSREWGYPLDSSRHYLLWFRFRRR